MRKKRRKKLLCPRQELRQERGCTKRQFKKFDSLLTTPTDETRPSTPTKLFHCDFIFPFIVTGVWWVPLKSLPATTEDHWHSSWNSNFYWHSRGLEISTIVFFCVKNPLQLWTANHFLLAHLDHLVILFGTSILIGTSTLSS